MFPVFTLIYWVFQTLREQSLHFLSSGGTSPYLAIDFVPTQPTKVVSSFQFPVEVVLWKQENASFKDLIMAKENTSNTSLYAFNQIQEEVGQALLQMLPRVRMNIYFMGSLLILLLSLLVALCLIGLCEMLFNSPVEEQAEAEEFGEDTVEVEPSHELGCANQFWLQCRVLTNEECEAECP
ncbi:hypothetical protein KR009_000233 [Drosophila setifemur]|nr:hypothetical protein KR009_000233 [Drosophila setifemur]